VLKDFITFIRNRLKKGSEAIFTDLNKFIDEIFGFGEEVADNALSPAEKRLKDKKKAQAKRIEEKRNRPKRKQVYRKYASKFDKKFHLHFDGEIVIRERKGEQYFALEGAHNHDVLGSKIQLGEIRKPPGVSFHDLPDDVPFKANVEMKYNSGVVKKKNTSSFFPRNWDIKRVKEEIALVYDEMLKSGKELKWGNNTFKGWNSDRSFEISIEFDKSGNLTNAYPIVK